MANKPKKKNKPTTSFTSTDIDKPTTSFTSTNTNEPTSFTSTDIDKPTTTPAPENIETTTEPPKENIPHLKCPRCNYWSRIYKICPFHKYEKMITK